MRVSVLAATMSAALLVAPLAFAQEPAPAPDAAAVEPPADDPPAEELAEADPPAEDMKEVCRSMRDPRTRMFVRKCETAREREQRLKGLRARKDRAGAQTARAQ